MKSGREFLNWVSRRPCCVCGGGTFHDETGETLSDPHHIRARGRGKGVPDLGNVVPLCRRHHNLFHTLGLPRFQDRFDVSLWSIAKKLGDKWRIKKVRDRDEQGLEGQ